MFTIELNKKEIDNIILCLQIRLGIIETGDPMIRAIDAQKMGQRDKIKALSREQMELVIETEDLIKKLRDIN